VTVGRATASSQSRLVGDRNTSPNFPSRSAPSPALEAEVPGGSDPSLRFGVQLDKPVANTLVACRPAQPCEAAFPERVGDRFEGDRLAVGVERLDDARDHLHRRVLDDLSDGA
jgi:hypothetical protein